MFHDGWHCKMPLWLPGTFFNLFGQNKSFFNGDIFLFKLTRGCSHAKLWINQLWHLTWLAQKGFYRYNILYTHFLLYRLGKSSSFHERGVRTHDDLHCKKKKNTPFHDPEKYRHTQRLTYSPFIFPQLQSTNSRFLQITRYISAKLCKRIESCFDFGTEPFES
jgi:hypothetical protein